MISGFAKDSITNFLGLMIIWTLSINFWEYSDSLSTIKIQQWRDGNGDGLWFSF
jgi:hypothetical protein